MNSKQVKLISIWLEIQKIEKMLENTESEWAIKLLSIRLARLETEYFDLWYELNELDLKNEYQKDTNSLLFVEWCMEKCFNN